MSNEIVRFKGGYNFTKAHAEATKNLAYYEEGLCIDVAARVIDAMENHGVTRSDLARRLEVSPAYITKILQGHANLSLESLAKLAFALDLKWECILISRNAQVGLLAQTYKSGVAATARAAHATTREPQAQNGQCRNMGKIGSGRFRVALSGR